MASRYKFSEEEIKVIQQRGHRVLKKINSSVQELKETHKNKNIRLMFQDEASFGRINKPKYCWCEKGSRPCVPCGMAENFV